MNFSKEQLTAAGFAPTNDALPFFWQSFERPLTNGNVLVIARPAQDRPRHLAVEFEGTAPKQHYWLSAATDLAELVNNHLSPIDFK